MAENPVLKEARKRGIISAGTPTTGSAGGAAAQSGGANPVVQQFNGTLAQARAANQQRIIETTKAQTPAVTQQQDGGFDLAKFMVGTLGKGANAVAKAGSSTLSFLEKSLLEPLFPGITESTPIQDLNRGVDRDTAYLDSKYSANTAKGGKAAKIAEDVGVGVIQAIPQAVAALGTAGSSLAAQGLSKAASASPSIVNTLKNGVSQMAKNPNYWTSFLTTVGNDYESAKADGVDDTRAGLYAVADSLLGAAVEVSGGIQKLPAELQGNRFTVRKWIDTMLDEGKEEVVQGVLSRGLENVVYDKGNAIASLSDENAIFNPKTSAREFGMGTAVGGILGGVQGAASNVLRNGEQAARNAQTAEREGNPAPVVQNAPQAPQMGNVGTPRVVYETSGDFYGYLAIEQMLARGKINNTDANTIIDNFDLSEAFTEITGVELNGTREQKRNTIRQTLRDRATIARENVALVSGGAKAAQEDYERVQAERTVRESGYQSFVRGIFANGATIPDAREILRNPEIKATWEAMAGKRLPSNSKSAIKMIRQTRRDPARIKVPDPFAETVKPAAPVAHQPAVEQTEGSRPAENILEQEVERLFGQSEAAPQTEAAPTAQSSMDPLLKLLMGGKRVDQTTLSGEQFDALADRSDMAMDAAGRVFRVEPEQHIDLRRSDEMGNRKINAFQFDHPEIHPYYKEAAAALLDELSVAQKGGQLIKRGDYHTGEEYFRTKRGASERISSLLDDYGLSYAQIEKACNAIINDQGQENIAAAKRVEFVLDEMLSGGYQSMSGFIPANQNYLAAKAGIVGSQAGVEHESMIPDDLDAVPGDDGLGAANAGFDPYSHLQNQTDRFHPEGAYAARPVDVPTTNFEGRNIPRSASNIMGAQAIGDSDVRFIEQQIADGRLAFDTIRDTDAVARAQQTIAQNGFGGAMEQYRQAANAGVATKNNTALGQQLLLQAMREGDVRNTAELLSLYTRNSTTAAQAMQAQSIMRKLSPEGQLLSIQRAVQDLNERYGLDETLSEQDVQDFLNAGSDAERQQVRDRIFDEVADRIPRTFRGRFDALRYLAMLGNPRTHIRNILGNTLFQVPVAVKNRVGAVIEAGANRATGGRVERTKSITGANPLGQLAREARADFENVRDFLDQSSRYRDERGVDSIKRRADPFSNNNPVGRTINRLSRGNSDLLEAEDTAAKRFIYAQSLAGYLKANGVSSIQDADPALLTRARNYAADEAARNTFTDRNMVSDAVARLGRASRSDNPTVRAAGYMVEGTLPFKRTPANIAVRSVEYSPTGAVLGAVETVRGARAGDVERVATGLDRVAAGVSGTALLAAGFLAAGAGYVTGGEDEDEKQQGFNDLTGHQSYALEMEDGSSVTLDWLAPEAIPFFMGVELYNAGIENGLTLEEVTDALKNLSSPMLEMSMLQGLNDTVNNAAYAVNRGDNVIASLVTSALTNYLTQIFPTVGGQVERTGETERMSTYIDKNSAVPSDVQYTIGKVSQKIPGWDYQQIPYIDAWGRTEETGSEAERIFNNFFNPAYVSQVDVDKVEQELQRVKDATGDSGVFPERAGRSITVNGEKKDLTAEEYQKYAKAVGQSSYQLVKDGVNLPAYGAMSDTGKAEYISRLYKYATQAAKSDVSDYEVESWVKNAKTAKQDIGVSTAEYIALYEKYGPNIMSGKSYEKTKRAVAAGLSVDEWAAMKDGLDANGNDSVSQAEAKAYLNSHGFDRSTKADLWAIINSSWKKNPYA